MKLVPKVYKNTPGKQHFDEWWNSSTTVAKLQIEKTRIVFIFCISFSTLMYMLMRKIILF